MGSADVLQLVHAAVGLGREELDDLAAHVHGLLHLAGGGGAGHHDAALINDMLADFGVEAGSNDEGSTGSHGAVSLINGQDSAGAQQHIGQFLVDLADALLSACGTEGDRAMAAGASFIVAPGFDPEVCKHVIDKGGIMMPGTCSAGEMQQAMNMGCEALKFFPAEANGGVGMLKNIGAALKSARWMCTGGVNAKNVNDYLGYDQIFAVGGTWMCKSDVIKAHDWAKITAQSKEAVDTMLGLKLMHVGINTENEEEAMKLANLIGSLLNMKVAPGNSSIFVGNKEFEIMKKPGRGTNGHIAIGCNNVDRAIYHLSQRGVKFDLDSKVVKNGKTIACYFADEIGGFAFHLVQA